MFSGTALDSRGLDIAEEEEKMFVFAISLLGATIQDSSIRERSDDDLCTYFLLSTI